MVTTNDNKITWWLTNRKHKQTFWLDTSLLPWWKKVMYPQNDVHTSEDILTKIIKRTPSVCQYKHQSLGFFSSPSPLLLRRRRRRPIDCLQKTHTCKLHMNFKLGIYLELNTYMKHELWRNDEVIRYRITINQSLIFKWAEHIKQSGWRNGNTVCRPQSAETDT